MAHVAVGMYVVDRVGKQYYFYKDVGNGYGLFVERSGRRKLILPIETFREDVDYMYGMYVVDGGWL